jgi:glycosyltransferase involved in cell wall biosynthesis
MESLLNKIKSLDPNHQNFEENFQDLVSQCRDLQYPEVLIRTIEAVHAGRKTKNTAPSRAASSGTLRFASRGAKVKNDLLEAKKRKCIFTVVARNYLSLADVLMTSIKRHNQSVDLKVYLVDAPAWDAPPADYEVIAIERIAVPTLKDMKLRYDVTELSTAVKPFVFLELKDEYEKIVYLDPDIYVYDSLENVFDSLDKYDCIITPHILSPYLDDRTPTDHDILSSGIYNLGFLALSTTSAQVISYLNWWSGNLKTKAISSVTQNLFTDQRWCDYIPAFISRALISRDRGLNVAYWNLHERHVKNIAGRWRVGSEALIFFHYSGLRRTLTGEISKHQNRFTFEDLPECKELFVEYVNAIQGSQFAVLLNERYRPFGDTSELAGNPLIAAYYRAIHPNPILSILRNLDEYLAELLMRPEFIKIGLRVFCVPGIIMAIFRRRPDLVATFDEKTPEGIRGLLGWFDATANREYAIPSSVISDILARPADNFTNRKLGRNGNVEPSKYEMGIWSQRPDLQRAINANAPDFCQQLTGWSDASVGAEYGPFVKFPTQTTTLRQDCRPMVLTEGSAVNVVGNFLATDGIAERCRQSTKALEVVGIKVKQCIFPVAEGASGQRFDRPGHGGATIFHVNADQTLRAYANIDKSILSNNYNIGCWVWELPRPDVSWKYSAAMLDEIWVPSDYVREIFSQITGKTILKIPEPVSVSDLLPISRAELGIRESDFVCLVMFDCNSFIHRKNPIAAVRAFSKAFKRDRSCKLVIKTKNAGDGEAWQELLSESNNDQVVILNEDLSRQRSLGLLKMSDVYMSLHRAEGFGRIPAEAMLLGTPTVVTGYSGVLEYANRQNSILVDYELVSVRHNEYPTWSNQVWAEADICQAADGLRRLREDHLFRKRLVQTAMDDIRSKLSYEVIGSTYRKRLREIGLFQ